jgi:hypothetical protein
MESEPPAVEPPPIPQPPIIEPERPRITPEEIRGERELEQVIERQRALGEPPVSMRLSDQIPARLASLIPSMSKLATTRPTADRPQPVVNRDVHLSASPNPEGGVVIGYDPQHKLAYVHFEDQKLIAEVGSNVYIKVDPARGKGFRGTWKLVTAAEGRANLVPIDSDGSSVVLPGDHVMFGAPPVSVVPVGFIDR